MQSNSTQTTTTGTNPDLPLRYREISSSKISLLAAAENETLADGLVRVGTTAWLGTGTMAWHRTGTTAWLGTGTATWNGMGTMTLNSTETTVWLGTEQRHGTIWEQHVATTKPFAQSCNLCIRGATMMAPTEAA